MGLRDAPVYDRDLIEARIRRRQATEQFQELPEDAQQEYRDRWRRELQIQIDREDRIAGLREESIVGGLVFFLLSFFAFVPFSWVGLLAHAAVGALFGWLLHATRAGRWTALAVGLPMWIFAKLLAISLGGHPGSPFDIMFAAFATCGLGVLRELRSSDADPSGLRRRRARRWKGEGDAPGRDARGGAAERLPPRAHSCLGARWTAPEQGGDERRPAAWTDWDLGEGDEES